MTVASPNIGRAAAVATAAAGGGKDSARAFSTLGEALVSLNLQALRHLHLSCLKPLPSSSTFSRERIFSRNESRLTSVPEETCYYDVSLTRLGGAEQIVGGSKVQQRVLSGS